MVLLCLGTHVKLFFCISEHLMATVLSSGLLGGPSVGPPHVPPRGGGEEEKEEDEEEARVVDDDGDDGDGVGRRPCRRRFLRASLPHTFVVARSLCSSPSRCCSSFFASRALPQPCNVTLPSVGCEATQYNMKPAQSAVGTGVTTNREGRHRSLRSLRCRIVLRALQRLQVKTTLLPHWSVPRGSKESHRSWERGIMFCTWSMSYQS